jgi:hypothetical protein
MKHIDYNIDLRICDKHVQLPYDSDKGTELQLGALFLL